MDAVQRKKNVFIIEDNSDDIDLLVEALGEKYVLSVYTSGEKGLHVLETRHPDLILLDVMLPGLDGYEICRRLKAGNSTVAIPIIFLTAFTKTYHEEICLSLGADDYMRKPIVPEIVRARVHHQLARAELRDRLESLQQNQALERAERAALEQFPTILMLSNTHETASHVQRTKVLFSLLAEGTAKTYPERVKPEHIGAMSRASIFHDIGMVHLPENLLRKCDTPDADACQEIQNHTTLGGELLSSLTVSPEAGGFLSFAIEIAEYHHEKWDGTGYPRGLSGEDIPASARIMALVDTYDLLTSNRAYRRHRLPLSHIEAVKLLKCGDEEIRPGHFDPYILEAFLQQHDKLSRA